MITEADYARRLIESMLVLNVRDRNYVLLEAFEANGVPAVHGLNAALNAGHDDVFEWYLKRGVKPNGDTLVHAIHHRDKAIARILPRVRPEPKHVAAACRAGTVEFLAYLLHTAKVAAPSRAFKNLAAADYALERKAECLEELVRAQATAQVGTMALLYVMRFISRPQLAKALDQAPERFDLEKLYGHAILCDNTGAIEELRARAPMTLKVIYRAMGRIRRSARCNGLFEASPTYPWPGFMSTVVTLLQEVHARQIPSLPSKMMVEWCEHLISGHAEGWHSDYQAPSAPWPDTSLAATLSMALRLIVPPDRACALQQLNDRVAQREARRPRSTFPLRGQVLNRALESAVASLAPSLIEDVAPALHELSR